MTYGQLKGLCSSLLIGDTKLPMDNVKLLPLVDYGLQKIAMKADSLRLMTKNTAANIVRVASNKQYIRKPNLPALDDDILDIDDELCYALANFISGFLSKNKPKEFNNEAQNIMNDFNSKVYDIIMGTEFDPASGDFKL